MQKWLKAAEKYDAAKRPEFKPPAKVPPKPAPPKPPVSPPMLASFVASPEFDTAKRLLAASKQFILLGESEQVMSRTVSVAIDGDGLKRSYQMTGMAAAYSKEPSVQSPIDVAEALELLKSFTSEENPYGHVDEVKLVQMICDELNQIADKAP